MAPDFIQRFRPGPYGTNEGDIWSAEDSPLGEMLLRRDGRILINECFRREDGVVEARMYNVPADTDDPDLQDLIRRAREGTPHYLDAKQPLEASREVARQLDNMTDEQWERVLEIADETMNPDKAGE
jgi:hypothetical protein